MEIIKEKIAIIGAGNLGRAIADGLVKKGLVTVNQLALTRRNAKLANELKSNGYQMAASNAEAIHGATWILLCVQPKQVGEVLVGIKPILKPDQIVVSVVTGVSIAEIAELLPVGQPVLRAMPNTAIGIGESMTCLSSGPAHQHLLEQVAVLFNALGETMIIEERLMQAATVLGASGIAFFMRYLRAATQGGIQMGFHPEEAQKIAVQTAKGAAQLILGNHSHPEVEIDRVTTPQGCTIEGLNEMEHQGFSSALIKGLMVSYHKIANIRK